MTKQDIKRRYMEIEVHNLVRRNEVKLDLEPIQTSYRTALMIAEDEIRDHPIDGIQQATQQHDK